MAVERFSTISDNVNTFFKGNRLLISSGVPTSGTFTKGDLIISSIQLDSIFGWVCIADGTPGTWLPLDLRGGDIDLSEYVKQSTIGNISDLTTENKDNIINAINELNTKFGEYLEITSSITDDINDLL